MTNEVWKPIPSTQGKYEASSLGRVRHARKGNVLAGHTRTSGDRPNRPERYNFQKFTLYDMAGNVVSITAQRAVCEAFHGLPPADGNEYDADHKNHNSLDHRPDNLVWKLASVNRGKHGSTATQRREAYKDFLRRSAELRAA